MSPMLRPLIIVPVKNLAIIEFLLYIYNVKKSGTTGRRWAKNVLVIIGGVCGGHKRQGRPEDGDVEDEIGGVGWRADFLCGWG